MKPQPIKIECKVKGCPNFCYSPNVYCGHCAGYAHEMTKEEKRDCIISTLMESPDGE